MSANDEVGQELWHLIIAAKIRKRRRISWRKPDSDQIEMRDKSLRRTFDKRTICKRNRILNKIIDFRMCACMFVYVVRWFFFIRFRLDSSVCASVINSPLICGCIHLFHCCIFCLDCCAGHLLYFEYAQLDWYRRQHRNDWTRIEKRRGEVSDCNAIRRPYSKSFESFELVQ